MLCVGEEDCCCTIETEVLCMTLYCTVYYCTHVRVRVLCCAVQVVRASVYDSHSHIGLSGFYGAGVRAKWSPNTAFFCIAKMGLIFLLYCDLHGARKTMSCFIRSESAANSEKQF